MTAAKRKRSSRPARPAPVRPPDRRPARPAPPSDRDGHGGGDPGRPAPPVAAGSGARLSRVVAFVLPLLGALLLVNLALARAGLPDYGTWTGNRPLEQKLRLLAQFASQGPIDAIVLGSSVGDVGFNAERFSQSMSARLGREYRAFNFATAGAQPVTFAKLYKLVRTVARPAALLVISTPVPKRAEQANARTPDQVLEQAPVAGALSRPPLLALDRTIWELPMFRYAAAARDVATFGRYANIPPGGGDIYYLSPHGDRLSLTFETTTAELARYRQVAESQLSPRPGSESLTADLAHFFSDADIAGIDELREMTVRDGCEVLVVSHGPAATFVGEPSTRQEYHAARHQYSAALAHALRAKLVDHTDRFAVPSFAIRDIMHLNYHGATAFAETTVSSLLSDGSPTTVGSAHPWAQWRYPEMDQIRPGNPTFNLLSAVVLRGPWDLGAVLRVRLVRSESVPALPDGELFLALGQPAGGDLVAPAARIGPDELEGWFPSLVGAPPQVLIARVLAGADPRPVALHQPLAGYSWLAEPSPAGPPVESAPGVATAGPSEMTTELVAEWEVVRPGGRVAVRWAGLAAPAADDWVGLFPAGGSDEQRLLFAFTGGGASGRLELDVPAAAAPGDYELRLFARGSWRRVASATLHIQP